MTSSVFSEQYLDSIVNEARASHRLRKHRNVHSDYSDPCQRFFNAIEPDSYIRPHRHAASRRSEMMIAVRGRMVLIEFDDAGVVVGVHLFGNRGGHAVGVEVHAATWHTVFALDSGSILLEVKAGPFDPDHPKEPAPWAPEEGAPTAPEYLTQLKREAKLCDGAAVTCGFGDCGKA